MGWKDKAYWIRGGIIFGLLDLILIILTIITADKCNIDMIRLQEFGNDCTSWNLVLFIASYLPILFIKTSSQSLSQALYIFAIPSLIIYFVVGAIVGLIYGKIKSRRNKEQYGQ